MKRGDWRVACVPGRLGTRLTAEYTGAPVDVDTLTDILGLRDDETGDLRAGYTITGLDTGVTIDYLGTDTMRLVGVVSVLPNVATWAAEGTLDSVLESDPSTRDPRALAAMVIDAARQ